jgi:hypothetical protein
VVEENSVWYSNRVGEVWLVVVLVLCRFLTSVKCRHEHDVVTLLHLVLVLALQFPICFVDENQDTRSSKPACQKGPVDHRLGVCSHCVVQNE